MEAFPGADVDARILNFSRVERLHDGCGDSGLPGKGVPVFDRRRVHT